MKVGISTRTPPSPEEVATNNDLESQKSESETTPDPASQEAPRQCNVCRCCSVRMALYVAIPLLIAIGGIICWMAAMGPSGIQNPFAKSDPPGATEAQTWPASGTGGLTLTVENALETRYDAYFDEYITKWQASGTLSLSVQRLNHEVDCDPSSGRLKVCNGNYGKTDWRGLTVTFMQNGGHIIWATAKLNDYFLDSEGSVEQRYTLCHELGHGWGLPHTDENYWNRDRGDCMDYTMRPRNNLEPGQYNYDLLQELYGTVGGTNNGGRLRRRNLDEEPEGDNSAIPDHVKEKYKTTIQAIESNGGSAGHINLGEGYAIEYDKLLIEQ